jgi:peroxiredoxin
MQQRSGLHVLIETLEGVRTQSGERLVQLAEASPVMLVFLRHAGCTFCREALGDIARARRAIEATGTRIILVHMGDTQAIVSIVEKHGLSTLDRICDPEQQLYRAFGLKRGKLRQLLGPKVMLRGFQAAVLGRHGIGWPAADSAQMPGLFLIDGSGIIRRFRHRTAADRPDYSALGEAPAGPGSSL